MTRIVDLVLVAVTAATLVGCGRSTADSATDVATPSSDASAVITGLEKQWVDAILKSDAATIERLLAPEFVGTTNDVRYTKEEAIADVKTGEHEALGISNLEIHVFGDTAVATFDQDERSHHGENDFSGRYLFTNVWARQNGQWLAVASHGARIR